MQTPLNEEQLVEIKTLAGLFFSPKEIATMLGINSHELQKDIRIEDTPAYNAFWGGRLQEEIKFRNKVIGLANLGSSPAQTLVAKMIETSQAKMSNR